MCEINAPLYLKILYKIKINGHCGIKLVPLIVTFYIKRAEFYCNNFPLDFNRRYNQKATVFMIRVELYALIP